MVHVVFAVALMVIVALVVIRFVTLSIELSHDPWRLYVGLDDELVKKIKDSRRPEREEAKLLRSVRMYAAVPFIGTLGLLIVAYALELFGERSAATTVFVLSCLALALPVADIIIGCRRARPHALRHSNT